MPHFSKQSCKTLRLVCVNEEFQHYFIVDSPKPKGKSGRNISLWTKLYKSFLRYTYR